MGYDFSRVGGEGCQEVEVGRGEFNARSIDEGTTRALVDHEFSPRGFPRIHKGEVLPKPWEFLPKDEVPSFPGGNKDFTKTHKDFSKISQRFLQFYFGLIRVYMCLTSVPPGHREGGNMETKNAVALVGRLAADPELGFTKEGTAVANFAIAVNRTVRKPDGNLEDALDGFFDCELFGREAETFVEGFKKGALVQLFGSLLQKKFQTKGDQPRTISKIAIRVRTVASVVEAPKKAKDQQPAAETAPEEPAELVPA
jgi:single stranded DNA-binding protein